MERRFYQPTEKQELKWREFSSTIAFPDDEHFRAAWRRKHHGTERGWGLEKRTYILSRMTATYEYQMGLWQGRVDFVCGLAYQDKLVDEENANAYNLGYYRGYTNCESDMRGMDPASRSRLMAYRELT